MKIVTSYFSIYINNKINKTKGAKSLKAFANLSESEINSGKINTHNQGIIILIADTTFPELKPIPKE